MKANRSSAVLTLAVALALGPGAASAAVVTYNDAAANDVTSVTTQGFDPSNPVAVTSQGGETWQVTIGGALSPGGAFNVYFSLTEPTGESTPAGSISDIVQFQNAGGANTALVITFLSNEVETSGVTPPAGSTPYGTPQLEIAAGNSIPLPAEVTARLSVVGGLAVTVVSVPEPAGLALLGLGIVGMSGATWSRRRRLA